MKKIVCGILMGFILVVSQNPLRAQDLGMSLGYGTSTSGLIDVFYQKNQNSLHMGFSYQFSGARGKPVRKQKTNYGRTTDGTGEYFWTIDFGYGYHIKEKVSINGEISIGALNEYTNYLDKRFNGGGYHLIDESTIIAGLGANIGYNFSETINAFMGYNTVREITVGIRISLTSP